MLTLTEIAWFGLAAVLLALTPGPNMVYLASRSLCQGTRAAMVSLVGVALGFLLHLTVAAVPQSPISAQQRGQFALPHPAAEQPVALRPGALLDRGLGRFGPLRCQGRVRDAQLLAIFRHHGRLGGAFRAKRVVDARGFDRAGPGGGGASIGLPRRFAVLGCFAFAFWSAWAALPLGDCDDVSDPVLFERTPVLQRRFDGVARQSRGRRIRLQPSNPPWPR